MLEVTNVKVYDLKESVIASRNAMRLKQPEYTEEEFQASLPRAIKLAQCADGSGHKNFLKGIRVAFDLKYTQYITKQLQRYNFFVIVSSSSTMHKVMEMDLETSCNKYVSQNQIDEVNKHIAIYKKIKNEQIEHYEFEPLRDGEVQIGKTHNECLYYAFIRVVSSIPSGIELFARCTTNYMQLRTIYIQRKNHKLKEDWGAFIEFIRSLPYSKELITMED